MSSHMGSSTANLSIPNRSEARAFKVVECVRWGGMLYSFKLKCIDGQLNVFPGQYLKLILPNGRSVPYSISGFDLTSGTVELLVQFKDKSEAYHYIFECIQCRIPLSVSLPHGSAYLRNDSGVRVICTQDTGYAYGRGVSLALIKSSDKPLLIHFNSSPIEGLNEFIDSDHKHKGLSGFQSYRYETNDVESNFISALSESGVMNCRRPLSIYAAGNKTFVEGLYLLAKQIDVFGNFYSDLKPN